MQPDTPTAPFLIVGKIHGPHGVRGWIRVQPYTREADGILAYPCWHVGSDAARRSYTLAEGRLHQKGLIARLETVDDRDQAEALRGHEIAVDDTGLDTGLNDATQHDDGYYWHQLQGLTVINTAGRTLGVVDHLFETGANDVLVVCDKAGHEHLIPYLPHVVVNADLAARILRVCWDDTYFNEDGPSGR